MHNLSNTKIFFIIFTSVILSLFIQKIIPVQDIPSSLSKEKNTNPLYEQFKQIAVDNNLDLSFTQNVWLDAERYNYKKNAIFKEKPKSIDILFLGDSSISWGLIPRVIEQITGKKVAMYAYESMFLNNKSSTLFNEISKYYLNDEGIVIFSFDNWTKLQKPNNMDPRFKKQEDILTWGEKEFKQFVIKHENSFYEKYLSFRSYQTQYKELSEYVKNTYSLSLKSIPIYDKYLEPIINSQWHINKSVNKDDKAMALYWDDVSITLYDKKYKHQSIYSDKMPDKPMNNSDAKMNALAASKIFGKKIYMVPLYYYHKAYIDSRNIYYSYYKNLDFELCDLGLYHPKDKHFIMQDGPHMANTGGLKESILIGKWLKNYFIDK